MCWTLSSTFHLIQHKLTSLEDVLDIVQHISLDQNKSRGCAVTIAITIAIGHDRDCYVQFEYSCKQLYHIEKFFKINIGPKEF